MVCAAKGFKEALTLCIPTVHYTLRHPLYTVCCVCVYCSISESLNILIYI